MTLTKMWVPICLYCSNCTKFGHLILGEIIKIVATRCQILRLNASNSISAGALPQTPLGSLQRSPDTLAGFGGPTSRGRESGEEGKRERKWGKGEGGRRRGREGRGIKGKGWGLSLPKVNFLVTSLTVSALTCSLVRCIYSFYHCYWFYCFCQTACMSIRASLASLWQAITASTVLTLRHC